MHFKATTFKSVLYITSIIFTCQSLMWICLSILAILTFRCAFPVPQYGHNSFISVTIVKFWFEGEECKIPGNITGYPDIELLSLMRPSDVFAWMVGYLIVSTMHAIASICIYKHKIKEHFRFTLSIWCFLSLFIAIMDITLTVLFILDYGQLNDYVKDQDDEENITTAAAAMFILTARGFGLWLINFCLICYFLLWLKEGPQYQRGPNKGYRESRIHAYDNFAYPNAYDPSLRTETKLNGMDPYGVAREREFFPRRLSVSSFEAVTPFNQEEPVRKKPETPPIVNRAPKREASCCGNLQPYNYASGGSYHSHACPALKSELEAKLQTMRKASRAHATPKPLVDFSHDIRNFTQGHGRGSQSQRMQEITPPPAAVTCNNSNFD